MSFSLTIVIDHEDGYHTYVDVVDGQTYNLSPMWRRGCKIEATKDLGGRTCVELQPVLLAAVEDYLTHRKEYEALDPSNGWGDHKGYFSTLLKFTALVHEHPRGVVEWEG